jgi:hypothetical protein
MACWPVFVVEDSASRQTRGALIDSKLSHDLRGAGSRSPDGRLAPTDSGAPPIYYDTTTERIFVLRTTTKINKVRSLQIADAPLRHALPSGDGRP